MKIPFKRLQLQGILGLMIIGSLNSSQANADQISAYNPPNKIHDLPLEETPTPYEKEDKISLMKAILGKEDEISEPKELKYKNK